MSFRDKLWDFLEFAIDLGDEQIAMLVSVGKWPRTQRRYFIATAPISVPVWILFSGAVLILAAIFKFVIILTTMAAILLFSGMDSIARGIDHLWNAP